MRLMKGLKQHGTRTRQSKKLSDVKQTGICHICMAVSFSTKRYTNASYTKKPRLP